MSASLIEVVGHLRDVTVARYTGAKRIEMQPKRLIEHPDRPDVAKAEGTITSDPSELRSFFARHSKG